MCSIGGWYAWGERRPSPDVLRGMLLAGAERGGTLNAGSRDATGMAWLQDGGIRYTKASLEAKDFVDTVEDSLWKDVAASPRGLLHNRAKTKGTICKESNHPLIAFGYVTVHNGTVNNDDDLFEYFKVERPADVDSVAIPLVLSQEKTLEAGLKHLSVLSGGVTTAVWKTDEPDLIAIARHGPNELYLWLDRGAGGDILYWSSAYMSSVFMKYTAMGSLRFQTMTRMPEDRVLILSPKKARTFSLKRRPFLAPVKPAPSLKVSTGIPPSKDTTGGMGSLALTSGGQTPAKSTRTPTSLITGDSWRWYVGSEKKPPPVAENLRPTWTSRAMILHDMEARAPHQMTLPTGYGHWHLKSTVNGSDRPKIDMWFKPARRVKDFYRGTFGHLPDLPSVADVYDDKLYLEPFDLKIRGAGGVITTSPGYMCPVCGITEASYMWNSWKMRCLWCNVRSTIKGVGTSC